MRRNTLKDFFFNQILHLQVLKMQKKKRQRGRKKDKKEKRKKRQKLPIKGWF